MQEARLAIGDGFHGVRRSDGAFAPAAVSPTTSTARVERVSLQNLAPHAIAWAQLFERAVERNVFLDPAFALPLMRHVAPRRRPDILLVWDRNGPTPGESLIALLPITLPRLPVLGQARGFTHEQACLGTPLLDRDRGRAGFAAMLDWLSTHASRPSSLVLTDIPADGPFMRTILGELSPPRRVELLSTRRRAVLRSAAAPGTSPASLASAKTRKERRRQRRRLAERGVRTYVSARTPDDVARAMECFLTLERTGWKGERGTALLAKTSLAAFARAATAAMAMDGKCRIDALEIDGAAVAMGIVLTSGSDAFFWKTTFNEDLARFSPGVQFALDLTDAQLADAGVALTDSCAIPDHPMIDRLWPDRRELVDLALSLKPAGSVSAAASLRLEHLRRHGRRWFKAAYLFLRQRRSTH